MTTPPYDPNSSGRIDPYGSQPDDQQQGGYGQQDRYGQQQGGQQDPHGQQQGGQQDPYGQQQGYGGASRPQAAAPWEAGQSGGQGSPFVGGAQPGQQAPGPYGAGQQAPGQYGAGQYQPGQYQAYPSAPATKNRTPVIIGAVAAGILLLGGTGVVVAALSSGGDGGDGSGGGGSDDRTAASAAAVESFFTALAEGDSATAISHIDQAGVAQDLLTDDVLAVSGEMAPITEVVITPDPDLSEYSSYANVGVSYLLGDTPINAAYSATDANNDGVWLLDNIVSDVYVSDRFGDLEMQINGVPLPEAETITVFPGTYELTTTTEYVELTGTTVFEVTESYATGPNDVTAALSEDGVTAVRGAVTAAVEECVASTSLEAGCGLSLPATLEDGTELTDGSLVRSVPSETRSALESLEPTLAYDDPTLAEAGYLGLVDVEAECTQGEDTGVCDVLFAPSLGSPSVDLTDPELAVIWD